MFFFIGSYIITFISSKYKYKHFFLSLTKRCFGLGVEFVLRNSIIINLAQCCVLYHQNKLNSISITANGLFMNRCIFFLSRNEANLIQYNFIFIFPFYGFIFISLFNDFTENVISSSFECERFSFMYDGLFI